jgi:hypothetical protein
MTTILGAALQSTAGLALYRDALDPMGIDIGGDEFAPNPNQRRLPPMTADEIARHTGPVSPPRPTVTAWRGAGMDAYYFDSERGVWLHCMTEQPWIGAE